MEVRSLQAQINDFARARDWPRYHTPNNLAMAIGLGLTLRGFIVNHFDHLRGQFRSDMEDWVTGGRIKPKETVYDGIERAPEAFIGLFTGANVGKMVVTL